MKPRIPERNRDLRRYVLRHRLLRIAGYLLWLAAFWGGAMVYNQSHQTYTPDRLITGWKLGVWMLAAVLIGFFLFRIGQMLFDRPFTGVVVRSSLSHTYTPSDDPGTLRSMTYDLRLNPRLIVRTDAGKKRRLRFEQKPGFYIYYYEGSQICHLSGLPYPVCNPTGHPQPPRPALEEKDPYDDLSGGVLCAACGRLNPNAASVCVRCMHTLIDPKDLWPQ